MLAYSAKFLLTAFITFAVSAGVLLRPAVTFAVLPESNESVLPDAQPASDKKHFCLACNKTFAFRTGLIKHLKRHNADEKRYQCSQCHNAFFFLSELKTHVGRAHTEKPKPYRCAQGGCGKSFVRQDQLEKHEQSHQAKKESYDCPICGKGHQYLSDLKRHLVVHSSAKPYQCSICRKGFKQAANRDIHERKRHLLGKASKTSISASELEFQVGFERSVPVVNAELHYPPIPLPQSEAFFHSAEDGEADPFNQQPDLTTEGFDWIDSTLFPPDEPADSGKIFSASGSSGAKSSAPEESRTRTYAQSRATASGKFRCETCGSEYSTRTNLYRHVLGHQDVKPYRCEVGDCDHSFSRSDLLKDHRIKVHGENTSPTIKKRRVAHTNVFREVRPKQPRVGSTAAVVERGDQGSSRSRPVSSSDDSPLDAEVNLEQVDVVDPELVAFGEQWVESNDQRIQLDDRSPNDST